MKLPLTLIDKIEKASDSLGHGKIIIEIHQRNFTPVRFIIHREESILPADIGLDQII